MLKRKGVHFEKDGGGTKMAVQYAEHEDLQVVVFTIGEGEFAIHISLVREIINITKLVALPNMPHAMVGIIDVRGAVLPVVDLGQRFTMKSRHEEDFTAKKVLLVEMDGSMVGYLVDAVSEVLQVPSKAIETTSKIPGMHSGIVDSICNLEGRLIPLVDAGKLATTREINQLERIAKEGVSCSEI